MLAHCPAAVSNWRTGGKRLIRVEAGAGCTMRPRPTSAPVRSARGQDGARGRGLAPSSSSSTRAQTNAGGRNLTRSSGAPAVRAEGAARPLPSRALPLSRGPAAPSQARAHIQQAACVCVQQRAGNRFTRASGPSPVARRQRRRRRACACVRACVYVCALPLALEEGPPPACDVCACVCACVSLAPRATCEPRTPAPTRQTDGRTDWPSGARLRAAKCARQRVVLLLKRPLAKRRRRHRLRSASVQLAGRLLFACASQCAPADSCALVCVCVRLSLFSLATVVAGAPAGLCVCAHCCCGPARRCCTLAVAAPPPPPVDRRVVAAAVRRRCRHVCCWLPRGSVGAQRAAGAD